MMDAETLAVFRAEAEGLVESLESNLLALKDAPRDRALIDGAFRDLHTLKGTGAMFGRADIASFLHDFETAFDRVRDGSVEVTPDLLSVALAARDHVVALLSAEPAEGADRAGAAILSRLAALMGTPAAPGAAPDAGPWHATFRLPADTAALGGRPELVLEELRRLGARTIRARTGDVPPLDRLDPVCLYLGWEAEIDATATEDDIRGAFLFHEDGLQLSLTPPAAPDATAPPPRGPEPPQHRAPALMRVPAERLDEMMDRVGELVIAEARLNELAARFGDPGLVAVAEDIQRLATAMRDNTMSIRMTPIGAITGRFRRLVHDLSRELGKPLALEVTGEETELDKTVIERLADPLMHLIRNAADHGLEPPAARAAAGKPEEGRITLSARYSGAEVLVALSDDGGGLDRDRIRARAVERGLLAEDADPPDDALWKLIFEPGFSTAPAVTELSGRGVGMDVVRRTIEDLRGTIDVASAPGGGTTVTLRLPLTLAIIDGLLIDVAGERLVIPLAAVDEIVELPDSLADDDSGNAFLDIRSSLVPFLRLRRLLDSEGQPGAHQKVVVVTSGEGRVGLVVDRIIGSNQTVIKQLSPLHSGIKTFSGATILGDGAVALILDVPQLVARGRSDTDCQGEAAA
ncbi:two-component system, chemotaxis family, sensor kinase CheA [Tranquillimonas rosea]|uniref:Chemotaxis protein CheA n=1 Tax=Tranquillimonas rosea TaxID=641238 RepID=A0A1H9RDM5_9RHOB|nr:chemotaxis protein CheA [Tranquillimonas rosea]SER70812.1 two-component system, chemotaxis family, sensor kinase CheA [Tranquillimonas rosea]